MLVAGWVLASGCAAAGCVLVVGCGEGLDCALEGVCGLVVG